MLSKFYYAISHTALHRHHTDYPTGEAWHVYVQMAGSETDAMAVMIS